MKPKEPQIVPLFDDFKIHVASPKNLASPFTVSKPKKNHTGSYGEEKEVTADYPFGNVSVECEVRKGDQYNYSFSYKSDEIDSRVLVRLDTGDGTHNNAKYVPDVPLELSSVPTPHIHKYREDGYSLAYPIPGVDYAKDPSSEFDYLKGFRYLCGELNITATGGADLEFVYAPDGVIVFPDQYTDPNEGADFDNVM